MKFHQSAACFRNRDWADHGNPVHSWLWTSAPRGDTGLSGDMKRKWKTCSFDGRWFRRELQDDYKLIFDTADVSAEMKFTLIIRFRSGWRSNWFLLSLDASPRTWWSRIAPSDEKRLHGWSGSWIKTMIALVEIAARVHLSFYNRMYQRSLNCLQNTGGYSFRSTSPFTFRAVQHATCANHTSSLQWIRHEEPFRYQYYLWLEVCDRHSSKVFHT